MEDVKESYKGKSDRELLEEALAKLSQIDMQIKSLRWDINAQKLSSHNGNGSGGIGSQGGYTSTQSGY